MRTYKAGRNGSAIKPPSTLRRQSRRVMRAASRKARAGWDSALLDHFLADRVGEYKKLIRYAEVSCRTAKEVA